jgi:hypothetical protein
VRGVVRSIATEPNGKILIAGDFDHVGGVTRDALARLTADGSLDNAFQPMLVMGDPVNACRLHGRRQNRQSAARSPQWE